MTNEASPTKVSLIWESEVHRIHPFADGNGRVGRLLMAYQAIQNNIVPPLIKNESRDKYLKAINEKNVLFKFLEESIDRSLELIDSLNV